MKCSLIKDATQRDNCLKSTSTRTAIRQRDRYKGATLDDIIRYKMAPCLALDYVLLYLSLKFVGANLEAFGLKLEPSQIPTKLPPLYRPSTENGVRQNANNLIPTMYK